MPFTDLLPQASRIQALAVFLVVIPLFSAPDVLAGESPSGSLLYDQSDVSMQGGASPVQQAGYANDEMADDFVVAGVDGWTVTQIKLALTFVDPNGTDPGQPPYLIAFYPDQNGSPADTAVCEYDAAPGATDITLPGGSLNVTVTLPTPCVLPAGTYWMAMSVDLVPPPDSLWIYNAPPSFIGQEPVYRNPDNYWGTDCIDWTPAYSGFCQFNPANGSPNMVFQLMGAVGTNEIIFANGFDL
jgi:hypothetical protein